jgi:UDP-N-acetylglucosamine 1-carboxyvinyltransferase
MGAEIEFINKRKIRIKGGNVNLKGDSVQGTDLRACAALAMAGVIAKGETIILNAESIDRGYHNFVKNVNGCGGKAERFN